MKPKDQLINQLWQNKDKYGTIGVNIVSINKAGTIRKFRFYTTQDNRFIDITPLFEQYTELKTDNNRNLVVKGTGMDMVWDTLTTLFRNLKEKYNLQGNVDDARYYVL